MDYQTVYDAAQVGFDWTSPAFGLVFIIGGAYFMWTALRSNVQTDFQQKILGVGLFGIGIFWTTVVLTSTLLPFLEAKLWCEQQCPVVEGTIEHFQAIPEAGSRQRSESITVQGVTFTYAGPNVTPGFRQMASYGGPMREGLHVRIHYLKGDILQLEVARDEVPRGYMYEPYSPPFGLILLPMLVSFPIASMLIPLLGGWRSLARRYRASGLVEGQTFGMQSVRMGLCGSYRNCVDVTVGSVGIGLQPIVLIRLGHPRLLLRWSDVQECSPTKRWFRNETKVIMANGRTVTFYGAAGTAIAEAWSLRER